MTRPTLGVRRLITACVAYIAPILLGFCPVLAEAGAPDVTVVRLDGTSIAGRIVASDAEVLTLIAAGGERMVFRWIDLETLTFPKVRKTQSTGSKVHDRIYFAAGGHLSATSLSAANGQVDAQFGIAGALHGPLGLLTGIEFHPVKGDSLAHRRFLDSLEQRPAGRDLLISRGDEVRTLEGILVTLSRDAGVFLFDGRERAFSFDKMSGIVFGKGAAGVHPAPLLIFLASGDALPADAINIMDDAAFWATFIDGREVSLDWQNITRIDVRSDRLVYVSDLRPSSTSYAGRLYPPVPAQFDRSLDGAPIMLGNLEYEKGISVHSYASLTYELSEPFETFVATIGIADSARPRGSVIFRIDGGGNALYASELMTGETPPKHIAIPVKGVKNLTLTVDYGDELDLGDRAIWAGARLIRSRDEVSGRIE